jgi:hypothetical protein
LSSQATKEEEKIKIQHLANVSFWMLINYFQYLIHISVTSLKNNYHMMCRNNYIANRKNIMCCFLNII